MIIIPIPYPTVLLPLLVWAIDAYLVVVCAYLLAQRLAPRGSVTRTLQPIASYVPRRVDPLLPRSWRCPSPTQRHWVIALLVLVLLRHLLIATAMA